MLKESKQYAQNIIDCSIDMIIAVDMDRTVIEFNRAAEAVFGYEAHEVLGQKIDMLYNDPTDGLGINNTLLSTQRYQGITTNKRKNGEVFMAYLSASALKNVDGAPVGFMGISRDITQQRQAEEAVAASEMRYRTLVEQMKTAKETAESANAAKSEFLANMSHELRTPMNGVIGMTDLLLDTPLNKEQRKYLSMLRESADSLLGLLNSILDFSKIEAGKLELEEIDFDIYDLVEQAIDSLGVQAQKKRILLLSHIGRDVPQMVNGDPVRLKQVIINLIGNSLKFTEKGEVVLKLSKSPSEGDTGPFSLHLSVSDTGAGIPAEKIDKIFESFTQVDGSTTRKYGGTGLGLAITKRLVNLMNGDISAVSEVGRGSTFNFTVRMRPTSQPSSHNTIAKLNGKRILLIDGHDLNRQIIREMSEAAGMKAIETQDAKAALAAIEQASDAKEPFDLILMDSGIDDKDQYDLMELIKTDPMTFEAEVIMMVSGVDKEAEGRIREFKVWGSISKPVKRSVFYDTIHLATGGFLSETSMVKTCYTKAPEAKRQFKLLLAEDNYVNQELAVGLLEKNCHSVVVVSNGIEAIKALGRNHFDVVLMDVEMPEMNGLDATRYIRNSTSGEFNPNIPIIAMTAHAFKSDKDRCLNAGMNDYISKPISITQLMEAIERTMYGIPAQTAATPAARPEKDEVFDKEDLYQRLSDDEVIIKKICMIFKDEAATHMARLRDALAADNAGEVEILAHTIKGMAANLGGTRTKNEAMRMELAARKLDLSKAHSVYPQLDKEITALIAAITEMG